MRKGLYLYDINDEERRDRVFRDGSFYTEIKKDLSSNLKWEAIWWSFLGGWFSIIVVFLTIGFIYRKLKLSQEAHSEKALQSIGLEFAEARDDFRDWHRNLFPGDYPSDILNNDEGED